MTRARTRQLAAVFVGVALAAAACGSGDDVAAPTTGGDTTLNPATTAPATTPTTPAPSSPPTSRPTSPPTVPPTSPQTVPPTSAPPAAGNPFVGDEVEVASEFFTAPFVMRRAGGTDDLVAFDGVSDDGSFAYRCVAVFRSGDASWREWCTEPGVAGSFVIVDGIDPWLVEVGAEPGDVTLTRQPFDWAVASSGCDQPIVSIATAAALGPASVAGLWCAGTEALLTYSSVFLQPGPADGGLALLSNGAEGWNLVNAGTSLDCGGYPDGIDRCALFGAEGELFGAVPMPSAAFSATHVDAVQVEDVTEALAPAASGAADVDAIVAAITTALTPEEPEATPVVTLRRSAGWGLDALLVEVPALDDSVRADVYHVWIDPGRDGQPARVVRAFQWSQCARGLGGPGLCL